MSGQSSATASAANIMLAIHEKKTTPVDLYRPLRNYIASHYSDREASLLEDDLQTIKSYRSDLECQSDPTPAARCDLLVAYYKCLCLIEMRFPISPDLDHVNSLTFTWHDAFKNKSKAAQQNIHLEKVAVLFNLGTAYSQIGLLCDQSLPEGRRDAIHAFIGA